jgi:effector-binding domain-containing protein
LKPLIYFRYGNFKAISAEKPDFVSEVVIKTRPKMRVVSLSGRGDPMRTFDNRLKQVYEWLKGKGIKPADIPSLGIYYKNRAEVGVENVEWDACVPVNETIEAEGDLKFQMLPEAKVASTTLSGGYDLIGPALKYLEAVTKANNIKTKWPLTEVYLREGEKPVTELQYLVEK